MCKYKCKHEGRNSKGNKLFCSTGLDLFHANEKTEEPLRQEKRWDYKGEEKKMTFRRDLVHIQWFSMPNQSKFIEGSIYKAEMEK